MDDFDMMAEDVMFPWLGQEEPCPEEADDRDPNLVDDYEEWLDGEDDTEEKWEQFLLMRENQKEEELYAREGRYWGNDPEDDFDVED